MKKLLKVLFVSLPVTTILSMATVYSDGTNTKDWVIYDGQGVIESNNGVIQFIGDGVNTGYRLRINDSENNILNWSMNSSDNPYTIYVRVNTTEGIKYLRYRKNESNLGLTNSKRYIFYALNISDGDISRNISDDIKKYLPGAKLINIEWFFVKGDISIDNVETKSSDNNGNEYFKELMNEEFSKIDQISFWGYLRFYDNEQFAVIAKYSDYGLENVTHYTLKNNELISFQDRMMMAVHYFPGQRPRHEVSSDKKRLTIYDISSTGVTYDGGDPDIKTVYDISNFNNIKKISTEKYDSKFTSYVRRTDKTLDDWKAFNADGSINNNAVYSCPYESICFNSPNRSVSSRIKLNDSKEGAENISWEFYSRSSYYSIYVVINTKKGYRYMIYTPVDNDRGISESGNRILFGLGEGTGIVRRGVPTKFFISRNIKDDLKKYEPDNEFISFNRFIVRGSGSLSELTTFKDGGLQ